MKNGKAKRIIVGELLFDCSDEGIEIKSAAITSKGDTIKKLTAVEATYLVDKLNQWANGK
jgi:hypothetical protein